MYWRLYRLVMKLAHRYHWHYAPPCYPEGDTMLWCHWCGFRSVVKRAGDRPVISGVGQAKSVRIPRPRGRQET